ncbi:ATP-binding cassette domain-containing protein [Falsiroseomonas sp. HW251]|uniref:ATP-binding cassette domain-containing protein n=1 Tax=Falsiroseomonas sp. HW251 TaxID=3390998 RepID=UPI003D32184B
MRDVASALPLVVRDLRYEAGGVAIIRGLDLVLEAGAPTLILGPNGAGKSVLLRLLHGLLTPTGGAVTWALPAEEARRRQAMVFQRPVLLRRSVLANCIYPLRLAGLPDAERATEEALARVGLAGLAGRPARKLSGGEQQRLALARAWAMRPEVLFLDEPTAALDPAATRQVEAIVAAIAAGGTKVVMTTHDLGQARRLAGDVVLLLRGMVNARGPADAFFDRPPTEQAASFLRGDLVW